MIEFLSFCTLGKKCPCSELFWSTFSDIRTEYREIRSIPPYSVQMRENADRNNPEYSTFHAVTLSMEWNKRNKNVAMNWDYSLGDDI